MGRSKNRRKGPTNPQAETLEKDEDQGVDAHEQRKEAKEREEDCFKGEEAGQGIEERGCSDREAGRSHGSEGGTRRKARRDCRRSQDRHRGSRGAGGPGRARRA